jgi:hypothetical protein
MKLDSIMGQTTVQHPKEKEEEEEDIVIHSLT